ncbi:sensor histidine kinase [Picosynechococcus sp. PCC 73109]|uniref:sensor histidine kinase n=1 Tax=Picosynechococcus sp. PCC 73109 TaxID=374982 RepID=UPI00074581F6|nr:HAMP domain-containing sensor histidine kinase [Picosynechococcus sp. PCC 73109]AMA10556.1 histidine kinase [Picosynechococcus sp. PCC 73109]
MTTLPQLLPVSPEYLSLCQGQLQLLAQGVGAEWGIVYLAQPDQENQEITLQPISAFPDRLLAAGRQGSTEMATMVLDQEEWLDVSMGEEAAALPDDLVGLLGEPARAFPLWHGDLILGILATGRRDRGWRSPEVTQIELIAESLVLACVLDQQKSWATERLTQQQHLQALEQEHFHDLLHQLRNPTMAISTFGKLLLKRLLPTEKNYPVAEGIVRESDRLKGLLTQFSEEVDLLTAQIPQLEGGPSLALPPNGEPSFAPDRSLSVEPLPVAEVVLPLVASLGAIATERGITLNYGLPEPSPWVLGNHTALMEVLNNLLENALKYTPSGGQVFLQVEAQAQELTIAVHDTGYGIPSADLPHVFERHYRGVQAESAIEGTGLGLAIAADLVGKMAGDIEVYSPTIGLPHTEALPGSTFMLWLKVASNPHQVTSAELPQGN